MAIAMAFFAIAIAYSHSQLMRWLVTDYNAKIRHGRFRFVR